MSKKSRFRGCFDRNMVNVSKHCSNPSQYLYHIHWSLATKLSSKKSLLLTSEILGLLGNTLATDKKYPVLNRDNLMIPTQMQLSYKQKNLFDFLLYFWNLDKNCNIQNKNLTRTAFVVSKISTPKTWLDKCLKSPVLEEPSTRNMVNVPKHCWNLHHSSFVIFIDHC